MVISAVAARTASSPGVGTVGGDPVRVELGEPGAARGELVVERARAEQAAAAARNAERERGVDPQHLGRRRALAVGRNRDDAPVGDEVRGEVRANSGRRAERHQVLQLDPERVALTRVDERPDEALVLGARAGVHDVDQSPAREPRRAAVEQPAAVGLACAQERRAGKRAAEGEAAAALAALQRRHPLVADVRMLAEHRRANDAEVLHPDERSRETAAGKRFEHRARLFEIVGER